MKELPMILFAEVEVMAVGIFAFFVALVLGLSFYAARQAKSASGYFAAGGHVHWFVNGISFAGDYLSAASFLGICGMIATMGYDGFLYSIGYLSGWIVALFVVAEPLKRLGKYTFADALDAKFNSRSVRLAAAISTLVVSIFYLIPQMVGAGVLVRPLLGLDHMWGVIMVGTIVIIIVATAGMTSTTYVQFFKGAMLIVFSIVLVIAVCSRGLTTTPDQGGAVPFYAYQQLDVEVTDGKIHPAADSGYEVAARFSHDIVKLKKANSLSWWLLRQAGAKTLLEETQWVTLHPDGGKWINGTPASATNALRPVGNMEVIQGKRGDQARTGSMGPFKFLSVIGDKQSVVKRWSKEVLTDGENNVTVYYPVYTPGNMIMRPGLKFKIDGTFCDKLNFASLMLALFCGTAALPHILIRYYTVKSPAAARKSTIVAIASIGTFYVLTLYMGLGAMTSGVLNLESGNMSAPLLAKSFGTFLFAVISAIAFATVLGTVSGLIVAASGAVAHDLLDRYMMLGLTEQQKVMAGKTSAVTVGIFAIILGILFKGMNVSFLVGWAFAVAASANLPAIIMVLFWKRTSAWGVVASVMVGTISALGIILLSPTMYVRYGLSADAALIPLDNPGVISIPLSFLTLVVVSLMTQNGKTIADREVGSGI